MVQRVYYRFAASQGAVIDNEVEWAIDMATLLESTTRAAT